LRNVALSDALLVKGRQLPEAVPTREDREEQIDDYPDDSQAASAQGETPTGAPAPHVGDLARIELTPPFKAHTPILPTTVLSKNSGGLSEPESLRSSAR
jgi:hypothetical protein